MDDPTHACDLGSIEAISLKVEESDVNPNGSGDPSKPTIFIEGGDIDRIVDHAEEALLHDKVDRLFQRGGQLVRLLHLDHPEDDGPLIRPLGSLLIHAVDAPYLIERMTRAARLLRWDPRRNGFRRVDCPPQVANVYLSRVGKWKLPVLFGVIEAPTLRLDGSILDRPGYDAETGIYFDPGNTTFAPIPDAPTREDARRALERLWKVIAEFPFVAPCDRASAFAAIQSALIRKPLPRAPMFVFRAPTMGSGKSLLADIVSMIATGRPVAVMTQGGDENEDKKRMFAALLESPAVVSIDNVTRSLGGAALNAILTQNRYKDRILGESKIVDVPTNVTFIATGNNLVVEGDLVARAIPCDMDPKCERPSERTFDLDPYDYVPQHRGTLAADALTVLRAYILAGRPDQGLKPFGRFPEWALIRNALVWCGEADCCEGQTRLRKLDPVAAPLGRVLTEWQTIFGATAQTSGQVARRMGAAATDIELELQQALLEVATGRDGKLNAIKLGNWISKYAGRPEGGLRFENVGELHRALLWRVARVESAPQPNEPTRLTSLVSLVSTPVEKCQTGEIGNSTGELETASQDSSTSPIAIDPGTESRECEPGPVNDISQTASGEVTSACAPRNGIALADDPPHPNGHLSTAVPTIRYGKEWAPEGWFNCRNCFSTSAWRWGPNFDWVCGQCHPPVEQLLSEADEPQ